jgi:hypothetical protein
MTESSAPPLAGPPPIPLAERENGALDDLMARAGGAEYVTPNEARNFNGVLQIGCYCGAEPTQAYVMLQIPLAQRENPS